MKHVFAGLICALLPVAGQCDPAAKAAIALADHPEQDVDAFAALVAATFSDINQLETFGPEDVPDGHSDPFYWSVTFDTFKDGGRILGRCTRIGRDSEALVRLKQDQVDSLTLSFGEILDPSVSLQGLWPHPLPPFAPEAAARLDCHLSFIGGILPTPDHDTARASWATVFSDVQNLTEVTEMFGAIQTLKSQGGIANSVRRFDNAMMTTDASGVDVSITSWLLIGTS